MDFVLKNLIFSFFLQNRIQSPELGDIKLFITVHRLVLHRRVRTRRFVFGKKAVNSAASFFCILISDEKDAAKNHNHEMVVR
jgi:hypothetical protein